jgi:phage-related protein (TIGR01555 family)
MSRKPIIKSKKMNPHISNNSQMLQRLKAEEQKQINAPNRFKNFTIPETINADGNKVETKLTLDNGKAMDSAGLPLNQLTLNTYNTLIVNNWFMGYGELSLLVQNGILRNIVQTIADEVVKNWIEIYDTDKDDNKNKSKQEDKIKLIVSTIKDMDFKTTIQDCVRKTMTFGGCMLYPKLRGDDNERTKPLVVDSSKIKKGDLKYFKIIEPVYCYPVNYNASDPFAFNFYNPQEWNCMGQDVHVTRLMQFRYNVPDQLLLPTYMFFGIPLIQMVLPYLTSFESIRKNIDGIVRRYNRNVIKTNLSALVNYDETSNPFNDVQTFEDRIAYMNAVGDNFGILALDMETEEYQQFTMSLAGLDKLYSQAAEIVCAIARIPATKLFGTAPQGFNSTGEFEMTNFYDYIRDIQANIEPHIKMSLDLIQLSLFGEIDPFITFRWHPLEAANELEKSTIRQNNANADAVYRDRGIVTTREIREKLSKDESSGYEGLDLDNPDLDMEQQYDSGDALEDQPNE